MVETDDGAVHDLATSYFESLRDRATPVPPEAFAEEVVRQGDGALVE